MPSAPLRRPPLCAVLRLDARSTCPGARDPLKDQMMMNKAVNESAFDRMQKIEGLVRERLEAQEFSVGEVEVLSQLSGLNVYVALERTAQLNALYTMEQNLRQQCRHWLNMELAGVFWRYQPRLSATQQAAA